MEIYVATEQHFWQYENHVYAEAVSGYDFWQRYLDVFMAVHIVARVRKVEILPETAVRVTGSGVEVVALPEYLGPLAGIAKVPQIWHQLGQLVESDKAFLLRVPGIISSLLYLQLRLKRHPYALEVVGDPYESLSKVALGKSWGLFFRPLMVYLLKKQCHNSSANSYVTREALQKKYPPNGYSIYCSDVEIPEISNEPKSIDETTSEYKLIFVGSLSQRYKGLHVVLEALQEIKNSNREICLNLSILGDGKYRQEYEALTVDLGLSELVHYHGFVKQGAEVFQNLRASDIFVMPSLVEGLPRAMIEAMACGLPCIGSKVGGIPELLEDTEMVPPGDVSALAKAITDLIQDPKRMELIAARNIEVASEYSPDVLHVRRQEFYKHIYDAILDYMPAGAVKG